MPRFSSCLLLGWRLLLASGLGSFSRARLPFVGHLLFSAGASAWCSLLAGWLLSWKALLVVSCAARWTFQPHVVYINSPPRSPRGPKAGLVFCNSRNFASFKGKHCSLGDLHVIRCARGALLRLLLVDLHPGTIQWRDWYSALTRILSTWMLVGEVWGSPVSVCTVLTSQILALSGHLNGF